jgi:hypothetical protein
MTDANFDALRLFGGPGVSFAGRKGRGSKTRMDKECNVVRLMKIWEFGKIERRNKIWNAKDMLLPQSLRRKGRLAKRTHGKKYPRESF